MMVVVAVTGIVCAYAFHRDLLSLYNKYCEREAAVQRDNIAAGQSAAA